MRALVTGCAGFIGSHLTDALLGVGHEVVGMDALDAEHRRPDKRRNLDRALDWQGFEFHALDLARDDLASVVADCDAVFHLAAEPGVRSSWGPGFERHQRNNVLATHRLLEAVRREPPKRVVYASSSSVYGESLTLPTAEDAVPCPVSPYGVAKLAAEHLCGAYRAGFGVDVVALRYFSVYGPRQRPDMAFEVFCRAAIERRPLLVFGDGGQTRDFTYVDDVVAATLAAAVTPGVAGRVYNVGGGSRAAVDEAIALLEELAGRPLEVERSGARPGDVRDTGADTSAARRELGFEPGTGLADGLAAQFEHVAAGHAGVA